MMLRSLPTDLTRPRGFTFRNMMLASAVTATVALGATGAYLYHRENSAGQLASRAQLALEQHDSARAIDYVKRALDHHPGGETGIALRDLMARAMMDAGREPEARTYLQQVLAEKPDHGETLELLSQSYLNAPLRKLRDAFKPLSEASITEINGTIESALGDLGKLPRSARNLIAEGQLYRLRYLILTDQAHQATAEVDAAHIARDDAAAAKAQTRLDAVRGPAAAQGEKALEALRAALQLEPANATAGSLIAQYEFQDRHYASALAIYDQMVKSKAVSEDLALAAARSMIADETRQDDRQRRLADAQGVLEAYLKEHPKSPRVEVSLGDVLLDQNQVAEALKLGQQAANEDPHDLAAQILLINCRMREGKISEAMKLIVPLTTSHSNQAEVWYLLGAAKVAAGEDTKNGDAGNAFRKALSINPSFTPARQALLVHEMNTGNADSAATIASQLLRDDRYNMAAWQVTVGGLQKRGQADRARQLLVALAADPALPSEARPGLVRLLSMLGAPEDAAKVLAGLPPAAKSTLTLRAYVASAAGNSAESRSLIAQALAADPGDIDLRLKYADLLAQAGLMADVRTQLEQAAAAGGVTADQSLQIAQDFLTLRLPAQAQAALKGILERQPPQPEALALARQAQAMLSGGAQSAAAPAAGADANAQGRTVAETIRTATAALQQKKFEEALSGARAGLNKDNASIPLHEIAARALMGLHQVDAAVEEIVEAARLQPESPVAYTIFVDLFSTPEAAMRGIGYGSKLESVKPALGNWAMGRLAEVAGDRVLALRYFKQGLDATGRMADPRAAKDILYQSVLNLHAGQKDTAALTKEADTLAGSDEAFAPGIRLLAADQLLALGDRAAAQRQVEMVAGKLNNTSRAPLVLAVARRWLGLGQADRALDLMEKQVGASSRQPDLLDAYATLLSQAGKVDKAVEVRGALCKLDAGNPVYRVALAECQAAAGDMPGAMHTLDEARTLGATGAEMAAASRIRLLITMGLLNEAAQELSSRSSAATEDASSMLAIAQAWAQLGKPDDARKMAEAVPAYAAEYLSARLLLGGLEMEAVPPRMDAAVATFRDVLAKAPGNAPQIAPQLFIAYLRDDKAAAALELATQQRDAYLPNTPPWRTWVVYAATAAREGAVGEKNATQPAARGAEAAGASGAGPYDRAIALLNSLDAEGRRGAQLDIALMQTLQNKPDAAIAAAGQLADDSPAFLRSTLTLLARPAGAAGVDAARMHSMLAEGPPSSVLAALAATPADGRAGALSAAAGNRNVLRGDLDALVSELAQSQDAAATLHQLALAQRLLEAGWSTTALATLGAVDKAAPTLTYAAVLRHQALTDLHRYAEADAVRDRLAAKNAQALPPSARILLAASWTKQERYADALAVLEPLAALKRPDVLTTLATLHEKLGQLDQAIALHRQVRQIDPGNVAAANNLAYTLAAAHPSDKAALAEARQAIGFAIDKAPQITAFQDTLGWIQILSGEAAEGTQRIARALPSLRLDPAVHYHLGMGYARTGQNELARMHLMNVGHLAHDRQAVPELPLATEALRTLAAR